ncbi:terminase, partial [Rhizobium ruizarguesonis]
AIAPVGVIISDAFAKYFCNLADQGITLTDGQKACYVKKAETQLGDMKREYPSTPAEAFEASVEGSYYADQMAVADAEERIGVFPHMDGITVHMR